MNVGTAYVSIRADLKKIRSDLNRAEGYFRKSANNISTVMNSISFAASTVAASAFVATLTAGIKKAVDAASDLQEVTGKFNVVFEDQKAIANSLTKDLVSGYAMSTREARQYLASVQDLLVPMGVQSQVAAELSGQVVKLAADLGSFNNLETARVMEDIQSALVGNYETMKKHGVVLNATVVQQEALKEGLAASKDELTAADKAMAAYQLIVKGSEAAIDDMDRTAGSFANQQKQLNANIEELTATIGNELLPVVTEIVKGTNDWYKANKDLITTLFEILKTIREIGNAKLIENGPELFKSVFDSTQLGVFLNILKLVNAEIKKSNELRRNLYTTGKDDIYTYGEFGAAEYKDYKKPPPKPSPGMTDKELAELDAQQKLIDESNRNLSDIIGYDIDAGFDEISAKRQEAELEMNNRRMESQQAYWEWEFKSYGDQMARLIAIDQEKEKIRQKLTRDSVKMTKWALMEFGKNNEAAFVAYKAFAIAEATVAGIQAAINAWRSGMETAGPWAPAVAAAYAAASLAWTGAQISAIASASPGGGGGGSVPSVGAVGTYSASPDTGMPTIKDEEKEQRLVINIQGDFIGDESYIDRLVEKINDAEDRSVYIRYARDLK